MHTPPTHTLARTHTHTHLRAHKHAQTRSTKSLGGRDSGNVEVARLRRGAWDKRGQLKRDKKRQQKEKSTTLLHRATHPCPKLEAPHSHTQTQTQAQSKASSLAWLEVKCCLFGGENPRIFFPCLRCSGWAFWCKWFYHVSAPGGKTQWQIQTPPLAQNSKCGQTTKHRTESKCFLPSFASLLHLFARQTATPRTSTDTSQSRQKKKPTTLISPLPLFLPCLPSPLSPLPLSPSLFLVSHLPSAHPSPCLCKICKTDWRKCTRQKPKPRQYSPRWKTQACSTPWTTTHWTKSSSAGQMSCPRSSPLAPRRNPAGKHTSWATSTASSTSPTPASASTAQPCSPNQLSSSLSRALWSGSKPGRTPRPRSPRLPTSSGGVSSPTAPTSPSFPSPPCTLSLRTALAPLLHRSRGPTKERQSSSRSSSGFSATAPHARSSSSSTQGVGMTLPPVSSRASTALRWTLNARQARASAATAPLSNFSGRFALSPSPSHSTGPPPL